jgi:hypothetical protein
LDINTVEVLKRLGYRVGDQVRSSVWQDSDGMFPWLTILNAEMENVDGEEQLILIVTDHFRPIGLVSCNTVLEHREAWK